MHARPLLLVTALYFQSGVFSFYRPTQKSVRRSKKEEEKERKGVAATAPAESAL
jgi:hypothetical protein